jgi:hypothetical protein
MAAGAGGGGGSSGIRTGATNPLIGLDASGVPAVTLGYTAAKKCKKKKHKRSAEIAKKKCKKKRH